MNAFYKRFLRDEINWLHGGLSWLRKCGPRVHLAAFGKHPGWDDHMDDLGLDTPSLVTLKRILYLQGIAGNLATGAWEQLDEAARLPAFNHLFRWQRGDQYLIGRIWSSCDGKGRAHYPMILCAHVLGPPAPPAEQIDEVLQILHQQCAGTDQAEVVRQLLVQALGDLRHAAPAQDERTGLPPALDIGGLQELALFHRGAFYPRTNPPAQVARVAVLAEAPLPRLAAWLGALRERLDTEAPVLLLTPLSSGLRWIDIIVGEPAPSDFFCLRSAIPPSKRQ